MAVILNVYVEYIIVIKILGVTRLPYVFMQNLLNVSPFLFDLIGFVDRT